MMSDNALRDLNALSNSERKNECSSKGSVTKPQIENGNPAVKQMENCNSIVITPTNVDESVKSTAEAAIAEVEYVESQNLNDVDNVKMSLERVTDGLESKDWVTVCDALNDVRRLSIFHKEELLSSLEKVIPLIVKALKNPRSAVCKTAVMTCADIFSTYGDDIIDSLDPMLVQLLLKSSQDKRFVCEAADKALVAMTSSVSPLLLLPKLQTHLKHRNPRIRAKASTSFCRSVPRLGVDGMRAYGIEKLTEIAATQLSDQLPESREAARVLLLEIQTAFEKCRYEPPPPMQTEESEEGEEIPYLSCSWENFCQSKLSPLSAQAVLRVTNIITPREEECIAA